MAKGGARPGAGRPKGTSGARAIEKQSHAEEMLQKLGGDEMWAWAIQAARKKGDFHAVADMLKYWTDRAKGKAPQAVKLEADDSILFGIGPIAEAAMAGRDAGRHN